MTGTLDWITIPLLVSSWVILWAKTFISPIIKNWFKKVIRKSNIESIINEAKTKYSLEKEREEFLRIGQILLKTEEDMIIICDDLKRLKVKFVAVDFF